MNKGAETCRFDLKPEFETKEHASFPLRFSLHALEKARSGHHPSFQNRKVNNTFVHFSMSTNTSKATEQTPQGRTTLSVLVALVPVAVAPAAVALWWEHCVAGCCVQQSPWCPPGPGRDGPRAFPSSAGTAAPALQQPRRRA